jgi:hypothetical protein
MPSGSVYNDHTFNKEKTPTSYVKVHTSHEKHICTSHEITAQYIARIFTVQYKYINMHSTIQVMNISTIQVRVY